MSGLQISGYTLLEDNRSHTNRFNVRSETSDSLYVVAQNKSTGEWGCSCQGWIRYRRCKHLANLKPILIEAQERQGVPVTAHDIVFPKSFVPSALPAPKPKAEPVKPKAEPKVEPVKPVAAAPKPEPVKVAKVEKSALEINAEKVVEYALENLCATFSNGCAKDLGLTEKDLKKFVESKIGRKLFSKSWN